MRKILWFSLVLLGGCEKKAPILGPNCPPLLSSADLSLIYEASLTKERRVDINERDYWVEHIFVDPPTAKEDRLVLKISVGEPQKIHHKKALSHGCFYSIYTTHYNHPKFSHLGGRFRMGNVRLIPQLSRDRTVIR